MNNSLLLLTIDWLPDAGGLRLICELAVSKGAITVARLRRSSELEIRLSFDPPTQIPPSIEPIGTSWGDIQIKSFGVGIGPLSGTEEWSRTAVEVGPETAVGDSIVYPLRINLASVRHLPSDASSLRLHFSIVLPEHYLAKSFRVKAEGLLLRGTEYYPDWRPCVFDSNAVSRPHQSTGFGGARLGQEAFASSDQISDLVQSVITPRDPDNFFWRINPVSIGASEPDSPPRAPAIFAPRTVFVDSLIQTLNEATWLALIDASGRGKSQLARSVCARFENRSRCWISLRDREDPLSHLHEQFRFWALRLDEGSGFQAFLLQARIASLIEYITERVNKQGLLVIDDLPELTNSGELLDALLLLTDSFSEAGMKLITTGQYDLPAIVKSDYDPQLKVRAAPDFTKHDVLDMLERASAPEYVRDERIISLILGTTTRHPALVAQSVYWLKDHEWQIGAKEVLAFLSGDPIADVRGDFRRRLAQLEDDGKELIYRLSLLWDKFDRELALNISDIEPAVERPGEALDQITGPWIEHLLDNTYRVSPLIREAGKENLSAQIQHQIHQVAAEHYLSSGTISVSQAHTIALHFWGATNYPAFARFLIRLMLSAKTLEQAQYIDWAFEIPSSDLDWPEGFPLEWRIMLRAMQVRTCALAGRDFTKLDEDLQSLIIQTDSSHWFFVLSACLVSGPMSEELPGLYTLQRTITAIQTIRDQELPSELLSSLPGSLEEAVWFSAIRLETIDETIYFLKELQALTDDERAQVFTAELAAEGSWHLLDKIWWHEARKPTEDRNWNTVFQALDIAHETGKMPGASPLLSVEARSRSIILADYFSRREDALRLLEEAPVSGNKDLNFLIRFTKGCLLFDGGRYSEAFRELDQAYVEAGTAFSYFRFDSRKRAVVCLSKLERWHEAKKSCIEAIHLAEEFISSDDSMSLLVYDRMELLGELAWIHWTTGNRRKACASLFGVVVGLIKHEHLPEPRFREVFNKTAHALGWYGAIAQLGTPPQQTLNGGIYKPVEAGLFAISRERMGLHEPSGGFRSIKLLLQLGSLAQAVNSWGTAWRIYAIAEAYMTEFDSFSFAFTANPEYAAIAAVHADPQDALLIAARAVKTLAVLKQLYDAEKITTLAEPVLKPTQNIEDVWASVSSKAKLDAQQSLLYYLIGPVVADILASDFEHPQRAQDKLRAWAAILASNVQAIEDENLRTQFSHFFNLLAGIWADQDPSIEDQNFLNSVTLFKLVWYLVPASKVELGLLHCLRRHITALLSMASADSPGRYMLFCFGQFVYRFWLNVANTRGFLLSNPRVFRQELVEMTSRTGAQAAASVLRSAARAVGVMLPSDVEAQLRQLDNLFS